MTESLYFGGPISPDDADRLPLRQKCYAISRYATYGCSVKPQRMCEEVIIERFYFANRRVYIPPRMLGGA